MNCSESSELSYDVVVEDLHILPHLPPDSVPNNRKNQHGSYHTFSIDRMRENYRRYDNREYLPYSHDDGEGHWTEIFDRFENE